MKFILGLFNVVFILFMIAVAALFLVPTLPIQHDLQLLIVESGSMEPTIPTGSLVVVYPQAAYTVGDVITFESRFGDVPTTHRILEVKQEQGRSLFVTKGDANEEADTDAVRAGDILGGVRFSAPYVGFVLDFARQPLGFLLLIVLPALTFVIGEFEKIWKELRRRPESNKEQSAASLTAAPSSEHSSLSVIETSARRMIDIATPVRPVSKSTASSITETASVQAAAVLQAPRRLVEVVVALSLAAALIGATFLGTTLAYPTDFETSPDNMIEAASLDFIATPDSTDFAIEDGVLVDDDDGGVITLIELMPGSVDARYDVRAEYAGGNVQFCDAIEAESSDPFLWSGPVTALTEGDVAFASPWQLLFTLPDESGLENGDTCMVDMVFTGWHYDVELDEGYFDEERVTLFFTLSIPEVVAPAASFGAPLQLEAATTEQSGSTESSIESAEGTVIEGESEDKSIETEQSQSEPESDKTTGTNESDGETAAEIPQVDDTESNSETSGESSEENAVVEEVPTKEPEPTEPEEETTEETTESEVL